MLTADCFRHRFLGDHSEEDPPVPIPNTEVKLLSPDGTAQATVWESRTSPGLTTQKASGFPEAFCIFRRLRGTYLRNRRRSSAPTPEARSSMLPGSGTPVYTSRLSIAQDSSS